jgi:predicted nucleic acid-binding protein
MNNYLLDTNVVSALRKPERQRNDTFFQWAKRLNLEECFISTITLCECEKGIRLMERRDTQQGGLLRVWFEQNIIPAFTGRFLPLDMAAARRAGALQVPNPRPIDDAYIAAIALEHDMTLLTRNVNDFLGMGLRIINPWEPAALP